MRTSFLWQRVLAGITAAGVALLIHFPALAVQSQSAQQLLEGAVAAQAHGDKDGSARKFRELLSAHPEAVASVENAAGQASTAETYLIAGQTRFGMGQYDLARRDTEAAQRLDPKLDGLATLRGMILEQTADYDGALAILRQAILTNPNDYNAQFYLGAIYYFKRDMPKAEMHLDRALQLQPTSVQARYELALVARAEGHLDTALKELQRVVSAYPDWLQPHVELAALYYRLGRADEGAKERQTVDRMMAALQKSQAQAAQ